MPTILRMSVVTVYFSFFLVFMCDGHFISFLTWLHRHSSTQGFCPEYLVEWWGGKFHAEITWYQNYQMLRQCFLWNTQKKWNEISIEILVDPPFIGLSVFLSFWTTSRDQTSITSRGEQTIEIKYHLKLFVKVTAK